MAVMVWDANSFLCSPFAFGGVTHTMLEPNLVFNGRTPHLYADGDMSNPAGFRRAESVYFLEKFEQPIHLLLHKPAWERSGTADWADGSLQTTALYQPFRQPAFVNRRMPEMTGLQHPEQPDVTIPGVNALWLNHDDQNYPLFELFHQLLLAILDECM